MGLILIVICAVAIIFFGLMIWVFRKHRYFFKAVRLTIFRGRLTSSINDFHYFPVRDIESGVPIPLKEAPQSDFILPEKKYFNRWGKRGAVAFLVAKEGELIYEEYWDGHRRETLSNSFSMAKSVVVMLLGCAIKDGYIKSLDEPVSRLFPEYTKGMAARLTIRDLARMSTGMDWQEEYYLPFNVTTQAYYGDQLDSLIFSRKITGEPGKSFTYLSGNTQLLAMVLTRVLPCTLSEYLSKRIWKPLGMESNAVWMIDDSTGIERAYCCINATARDFLRLGQLILQKGIWEGESILTEDFAELMIRPGFEQSPQYGYGLWLDLDHDLPFYLMRGHLGQYVIIIPSEDLVITRLGKKNSKVEVEGKQIPEDVYDYIEGVLNAIRD